MKVRGGSVRLSLALLSISILLPISSGFTQQRPPSRYPPGTVFGADGSVTFNGQIDPEGVEGVKGIVGGDAMSDGQLTTEEACQLLIKKLPNPVVEGLAGVGSLFGLCNTVNTEIDKALKGACENLSGVYPITVIADGCEYDATQFLDCKYSRPISDFSCDGLLDLCMSSGAFVGWGPPDDSGRRDFHFSFRIPGCGCDEDLDVKRGCFHEPDFMFVPGDDV